MDRPKRLHYHQTDEMIWAVVAHSIPHAKKLLWADTIYDIAEICDGEYVNLTCKWAKEYDVSDQPIGMLDAMVGLRLGVYSYLFNTECPECGCIRMLEYYPELNTICCYECKEELTRSNKDESEET